MATKHRSQKLGPGELYLGETGSGIDISCQMTEARIQWDNDEDDAVPVLCGDTIPGDDTFTATLAGVLYQDMTVGGIIEWSWDNKGEIVPFRFVPATGAEITGKVKVLPVDLGGEVKKKNTSDIEWPCLDEPVFTAIPVDDGDLGDGGLGGE